MILCRAVVAVIYLLVICQKIEHLLNIQSLDMTNDKTPSLLITARKRSLGQGNIFAPVCHSVHRGEYLGRYPQAGTPPSTGRYTPHSPARYTSPGQVHPLGRYPLEAVHAGRYGQQPGSNPTGMHSCNDMMKMCQ